MTILEAVDNNPDVIFVCTIQTRAAEDLTMKVMQKISESLERLQQSGKARRIVRQNCTGSAFRFDFTPHV